MARNRKYNWEGLFDRDKTVLVRDKDYKCSQSTMVAQVRNEASRRRVRVKVQDSGETIVVEVVGEIHNTDKTAVTV